MPGTPTQDYRELMSTFPTGVAVVTGLDADGAPQGMTCSSIASATLLPPTLLVCLRTGSRTLSAVTARGSFAVNFLHDGGQEAAELFSRAEANRFSQVHWRMSQAGLPRLAQDAFAVAECKVSDVHMVGDHAVVLGEVTTIAQVPGTPLLYGLRRFAAWPIAAVRPGGRR
ncbi:flavin reductase (DIM6/NTAB) family NADH-FMN oxidoreductase RutF [Kibdelosporangium banguiense]|uniref:Flavin reductase (DIM6/NTAB) family NADH-FMN oxidoreductase RutF n=1 Tax=Kibdelosporangium banguiense TaxID=1365924 RepID=A0ABS4TSN5_9PSEU|nr:flavin reductase family protein [Kibdelosporangium banguiense]MBP2326933.1 flavin reductase (DIM6/NTAB) family NADH-FMN oxidoreductase RutF [Kibdelosporangium banguiense]